MAPPNENRSGSVSGSEAPAVVTVDVSAAVSDLQLGHYRYLDVRTEEEMAKGHLENSLNVPYMFVTPQGREKNPLFVEQVAAILSKDQHILVGCQSGKRSELACVDLLAAGFKVKNVGGGYVAWLGNGFPVRTPDTTEQGLKYCPRSQQVN